MTLRTVATLRTLAKDWPYFGRSAERLWMDGGSRLGLRICLLIGWAEYARWTTGVSKGQRAKLDGEILVRPTERGLQYLKDHP